MTHPSDLVFMRRAVRTAARGRGRTAPNPPVGAVVVRDGVVIGEGWHRGPGHEHAEVEALREAGDARGATLYLTLEPCTHQGRTPPCLPRVVASGIARLVIAAADPNPRERGAGIAGARAAGIDVAVGVGAEEAAPLIRGFAKWIGTGRPLVTVKIASSLDGRVAAADGSSRWITGVTARRDGHRMRAWADAVVVGVGTILADDPRLTCRLRGFSGAQPLRVVLDSAARTPLDAAILSNEAPTLVATTSKPADEALDTLRARGAEVVQFPARDGRIDLDAVLAELGRRGLMEVLVEGGPTVIGDLAERALVDRYVFYLAPKLLGSVALGSVGGLLAPTVAAARELKIESVRRVGADLRIEAVPREA